MDTDQQEADENEIPKLLLAKYAGNMIWRWLHCTATRPHLASFMHQMLPPLSWVQLFLLRTTTSPSDGAIALFLKERVKSNRKVLFL